MVTSKVKVFTVCVFPPMKYKQSSLCFTEVSTGKFYGNGFAVHYCDHNYRYVKFLRIYSEVFIQKQNILH